MQKQPSSIFCNLFLAMALGALFGCAGQGGPAIRGLPSSTPPTDVEVKAESFLGTWSLTDNRNELFNVIVDADKTARSNWSGNSIIGEFGTWEQYQGRWGKGIIITYRDGWRDVILVGSRGYEKVSFEPRASTEGWPESFGIAVRLRGVCVPLSGVFIVEDGAEDDETIINLKSNGLAESNRRPNNPGVWTPRDGDAWIYWADDWREHLAYDSSKGSYQLRAWKPATEGRGDPTSSRSASRMEKPLKAQE